MSSAINRPDRAKGSSPIYAQIQADIRDGIAAGRLLPGQRLPSEPELAQRFGTTRATVAHAMQQLVFERVVIRKVGSGSFVASTPAHAALHAPLETTRVRSFEEQLTQAGATIDYTLLGFTSGSSEPGEAAALHLPPNGLVYRLDRLRIVGGAPMSIENRVIPQEIGSRMTVDGLHRKSLHAILADELGLPVARVEGVISAGIANAATAIRLKVRRGSPLLIRSYTLHSRDGQPLATGRSMYHADFHIDYVVQQEAESAHSSGL